MHGFGEHVNEADHLKVGNGGYNVRDMLLNRMTERNAHQSDESCLGRCRCDTPARERGCTHNAAINERRRLRCPLLEEFRVLERSDS